VLDSAMRIALTIFTFLVAIPVFAQTPVKKTPADVMREIRLKVLTTPTSQKPTEEFPHVRGVIMDWPIKDTTVSLMASSVGDGSIYTTGDFGVVGGIKYEDVRTAAKTLVKLAEKCYSDAVPTTDFPYPQPGHVRFYLICYDGVRVIDVIESSLSNGKPKYFDMFTAGQRMIADLRKIAEPLKK
jgi:hypothetical protein